MKISQSILLIFLLDLSYGIAYLLLFSTYLKRIFIVGTRQILLLYFLFAGYFGFVPPSFPELQWVYLH